MTSTAPNQNAPTPHAESHSAHVIPWVSRQELAVDLCKKLAIAHAMAPLGLKARLYEAVDPSISGQALVQVGPTIFDKRRATLDRHGVWAIWCPIYDTGQLVDWGVFHPEQLDLRRTWAGIGHHSVNADDAIWDAHYHPEGRLLTHVSVWDWLRAGCKGVVPVEWDRFALWLKSQRRDLLVQSSDPRAAERLHAHLTKALAVPKIYERVAE